MSIPLSSVGLSATSSIKNGTSPFGSLWLQQIKSHPLENVDQVYQQLFGTTEKLKSQLPLDRWITHFIHAAKGDAPSKTPYKGFMERLGLSESRKQLENSCADIEQKIGLTNALALFTRTLQHTHYLKSQGTLADRAALDDLNNYLENELQNLIYKNPKATQGLNFELLKLDLQEHHLIDFAKKLTANDLKSDSKIWSTVAYSLAAVSALFIASRFVPQGIPPSGQNDTGAKEGSDVEKDSAEGQTPEGLQAGQNDTFGKEGSAEKKGSAEKEGSTQEVSDEQGSPRGNILTEDSAGGSSLTGNDSFVSSRGEPDSQFVDLQTISNSEQAAGKLQIGSDQGLIENSLQSWTVGASAVLITFVIAAVAITCFNKIKNVVGHNSVNPPNNGGSDSDAEGSDSDAEGSDGIPVHRNLGNEGRNPANSCPPNKLASLRTLRVLSDAERKLNMQTYGSRRWEQSMRKKREKISPDELVKKVSPTQFTKADTTQLNPPPVAFASNPLYNNRLVIQETQEANPGSLFDRQKLATGKIVGKRNIAEDVRGGKRGADEDRILTTCVQINGQDCPLYAVFDGEFGQEVSDILKEEFAQFLQTKLNKIKPETGEGDFQLLNTLKTIFHEFNEEIIKIAGLTSGSTACFTLQHGEFLYVVNAGDSRALISSPLSAKLLTRDNTLPQDIDQVVKRLNKIGSKMPEDDVTTGIPHIKENLRIRLSRGVGFLGFPGMNPRPKITRYKMDRIAYAIQNKLIIATKGLWNVATPNEVGLIIQEGINEGLSNHNIVRRIMTGVANSDLAENTAIILVDLFPHKANPAPVVPGFRAIGYGAST